MPGRRRLAVGAMLAALCASALACDSGGTECTCAPVGLTVNVPRPLADEIIAITPSGLACTDASIAPNPSSVHNATVYSIAPTQAGPCEIEIQFTDGTTFSDDLTVVETTGCCAGFRTSPPGAAVIDVPVASDAGESSD